MFEKRKRLKKRNAIRESLFLQLKQTTLVPVISDFRTMFTYRTFPINIE